MQTVQAPIRYCVLRLVVSDLACSFKSLRDVTMSWKVAARPFQQGFSIRMPLRAKSSSEMTDIPDIVLLQEDDGSECMMGGKDGNSSDDLLQQKTKRKHKQTKKKKKKKKTNKQKKQKKKTKKKKTITTNK